MLIKFKFEPIQTPNRRSLLTTRLLIHNWIYYMDRESVDGFLCPVSQKYQLYTSSKIPTTESPNEQTPTGSSEESSANPQIGNPVVTQGKPTSWKWRS
jgi:hypothetical protein